MKIKQILSIFIITLLFIFGSTCFADNVYNLNSSYYDNEITPYATYISTSRCNLDISNSIASAVGMVKGT